MPIAFTLTWLVLFGSLAAWEINTGRDVITGKCLQPILIDHTGIGWDDTLGRTTIDNATRTCDTRYRGCLVRLVRVQETAFHAVCRRSK